MVLCITEISKTKNISIKSKQGNLEAKLSINLAMKNDLSWWTQNITVAKMLTSHGQIQHVLRTDASSSGWEAVMDMQSASGRWA